MSVFQKVKGTTANTFSIGDGSPGDKHIYADAGFSPYPFIRYNDTIKHWEVSGNGTTWITLDLDELLEDEPCQPNNTYTITRVMGQVTQEKWVRTADNSLYKTIDYTYVSGKVDTEDRKVYAEDGVTVLAELTCTYTYMGSLVTQIVRVRVI
jgi:hypothetical protein